MTNIGMNHKKENGMALGLALAVVLIVAVAGAYFFKRLETNRESTRQDSLKKSLTVKAMDNIEDIKRVLRLVVFQLNARTENNNNIPIFNFQRSPAYWSRLVYDRNLLSGSGIEFLTNIQNRLNGQSWSGQGAPAPIAHYPHTDREAISITCVENCSNDPSDVPKIFDLQYVLRSEDTQSAIQVKVQIALEPPKINNIAYMLTRQPSSTPLTVASLEEVRGKFMVFFDDPTSTTTYNYNVNGTNVQTVSTNAQIRFANLRPLDFHNEFVTNVGAQSVFYGRVGFNPHQGQSFSNAPVNFREGVVWNAPNPSSSIQTGFQNLKNSSLTLSYNDPYGTAYGGETVLKLGRNGSGDWTYSIINRTPAPIQSQSYVIKKYKNDLQQVGHGGGFTIEQPSLETKTSNEKTVVKNGNDRDLETLTQEGNGWDVTSGSSSEPDPDAPGKYRTFIVRDQTLNSRAAIHVNSSSRLLVEKNGGSDAWIAMGEAPLTVMTSKDIAFRDSLKRENCAETECNVAFVSEQGSIGPDLNARTLVGNSTLSQLSATGLPSGSPSDTNFMQFDAMLVALNGQFTMPSSTVTCATGMNCPASLGGLELNGGIMAQRFGPLNAIDQNTGQIVSGISKLKLNFNEGLLRPAGTPAGLDTPDQTSLTAYLIGAVSVSFVDQSEAEQFFSQNAQ